MKFSIPSKDGSSSGMNTSRQLKDPNPNRLVFAPQHMQLTTTRDGSEGPHGMMTLDETITTSITMSHVLRKLPAGGNGRHIAAGKVKRCAPCDDEAAKLL